MSIKKIVTYSLIILSALSFEMSGFLNSGISARADMVDDLKQKIDSNSNTIKQLQQEIAELSGKLDSTSAQRKTLQNTINQLELNSKKLQAQIDLTKKSINTTDLQIKELAVGITEKAQKINQNKQALAENLRRINEFDSQSVLQTVLIYPNISTFSNQIEAISEFQEGVRNKLDDLQNLKKTLEVNKNQTEVKKTELVTLESKLADQNTVIKVNKSEKDKLLTQTKNQESTYKQLIADKVAKQKAFEKELNDFQSQLNIALDPSKIPGAKAGLLAWPTAKHTITQYFGNTDFAQAHAAVYNGSGHNGIDIGIPIGTPVMSAGVGTVMGTGDTDTACPGASFGKWVFVQHNNGLSTLYAHFSVIKVSKGDKVNAGDVLGYSGMTGYATGPHLHFTVYASQGVQILSRASKSCNGGVYTMPIADLKAYLNPMSYLSL